MSKPSETLTDKIHSSNRIELTDAAVHLLRRVKGQNRKKPILKAQLADLLGCDSKGIASVAKTCEKKNWIERSTANPEKLKRVPVAWNITQKGRNAIKAWDLLF